MKYKLLIYILTCFVFVSEIQGQKLIKDSLKNIILQRKDENIIPELIALSKRYSEVNVEESLACAGKALELAKKFRKKNLLVQANIQIADIYYKSGKYKSALKYYNQALDNLDQSSDLLRFYLYRQLGHTQKNIGNLDNAISYYKEILDHGTDLAILKGYNDIGTIYKLKNDFNKSRDYYIKALIIAQKNNYDSEIAASFNLLGGLYYVINQYDSCLYFYDKSLHAYRDLSDTLAEAKVLSNIGVYYKSIGEFKKSLKYNQKALRLRMNVDDTRAISHSFNLLGSLYLSTNNTNKALDFYLKALEQREKINDILGIAQIQNNIALVYKKRDNIDSALIYFNKSLTNYYQIGNLSYIANSINQIGNIYKKQNRYDVALKNYLKALKIKKELNNQNEVASILNNIGIIYSEIGNYNRALDAFAKSLEIKQNIGIKKDIAYSLHIIGNTYLHIKDFNKALEYYNRSLKIRKEINDKVNIASSLKNIGNTYLELNNFKTAITYLKNSLALRKEIGDVKGISDVLNDIGNFYSRINDYKKAISYYNQSLELSKRINDKFLAGLCYRKIGVIRIRQGKNINGINALNKSLQLGQEIDNLELIKNAYYELFKYYKSNNEANKALDKYILYTKVNNDLNEKLSSQGLIEIQMSFELEETYNQLIKVEDEISQLTAEKEIKDLTLKRQRIIRNSLLIIVIITLVSIFIIYSLFLNKRKTNILLQDKINEIDTSNKKLQESKERLKILNATKDKFFSIIAHDLRNPFNALYGLTKHLLDNFDNFSKNEIKQFNEVIYNSAADQLELLENLLYWSRTQRGKIKFSPRDIDLNEIILKNFDLMKMDAQRKNINLINEVNSDAVIYADYDMIMAILRNLISNAIKFSYENNFIKVNASTHKNYTEITIRDNGVGITSKNIKRLFRIDIHYSTTGTQKEQGSGLGLILCKEFVDAHKGEIWVESEINKGSIFKFTIPKK
ncbi:MAG: tetratricopeptide repeat protein [Bacteroidales bacterium]|nr:tetratricopeptide repeat protein [Bacteroidales bacterium]